MVHFASPELAAEAVQVRNSEATKRHVNRVSGDAATSGTSRREQVMVMISLTKLTHCRRVA